MELTNPVYKLFDLTGKVAVVTGGTGVLGGAIARALGRAGVKVGILGRRAVKAQEIADNIIGRGGEALALPADVLQTSELQSARALILEQWGGIDILINAAGGNLADATIQPDQSFLDLSEDALQKVIDLNLKGTVLSTKVFLEPMIERKKGVVINISSMAAEKPMTRVVGYAAAKAAVNNYTKWLSTEMASKYGEGIRVNAIAPGFFVGEQNKALLLNEDGSHTDRGKTIISQTPMGRFGEPEELAGTLLWLCSDAARFVTGIVVPVDGGFSSFGGV